LACGKHGVMLELMAQYAYDPASPNRIYFSIGSAVMAVTLILAFNQLIRPITRFRLKTGWIKIKYVYSIIIIAILFVFVAAILPFIPGKALPLLRYPFFWEFLAGLLLVFASLYFIWRANTPVHFTHRNYKSYSKGCTYIIGCGQDRDLRELADELYFSIEEIISTCKKYNSDQALFAKEKGQDYPISDYIKYALHLLNLLSDANFCRSMVCHVPFTATEIFHQIKKQRLYDSGGRSLVQQLVAQAFIDKDSILYREQDYYGLGHIKGFTNLVFGNYELIESGLNPLEGWSHWEEENLQPWKVKKYSEVLNVATEANITSNWRRGYPGGLWRGFEILTNTVLSESIKLDKVSNDEAYDSLAYRNLKEIQRGLRDALDIAIKHFQDCSLYSVLAMTVYNYYKNLSGVHSKDDDVRFLSINIWQKIFSPFAGESKAVKAIQKRLNIHFFDKALEGDLIILCHSSLIRLLINIVGISPSQPGAEKKGAILFKKKLFDLLKKHYENFAKTEPERAKNMLPDKVRYDEKKGQLIQTYTFGSTSVLDLR